MQLETDIEQVIEMKAEVFPKSGSAAAQIRGEDRVVLEMPSVVRLHVGPEQVARYDRDGNDLLLVLDDGTVVVIENFFVQQAGDRNDLVLVDMYGVTWWAQYGETWSGFDIAEIEEGVLVPPFLPLLAGLGILTAGAAAAGGSGGR